MVRDLKSVRGPQPSQSGHRHLSEVHEQVQLALYARAWEVAHPGDRVVGVGITEIGDRTTQFLELDPEIELDGQDVITSTAEVAHRRASEGSEPRKAIPSGCGYEPDWTWPHGSWNPPWQATSIQHPINGHAAHAQ